MKELFRSFPGIGPKQAERFAFFILKKDQGFVERLLEAVKEGRSEAKICEKCFRLFESKKVGGSAECPTCLDKNRDTSSLMVVAKEQDFESVEKSGAFNGLYFLLGDFVPILDKEPEKRVRIAELRRRLEKNGIKEVVLAFGANVLGENTEDYVRKSITDIARGKEIKISALGKGLSTGAEIEYSDADTIKNSLNNRRTIGLNGG